MSKWLFWHLCMLLISYFNLGSIQLRGDVRSVMRQTLLIERENPCVDVGRYSPV